MSKAEVGDPIAGSPTRPPAQPPCVRVLTRPQLRDIVQEIRRADRVAPVVAITSRRGERIPAFCAQDVREIVGSRAQLYFIPTGHLTRALAVKLGDRLAVENGAARIWWTRPSGHNAAKHPLIAAPRTEDDQAALAEMARQLKATRPVTLEYLETIESERDLAARAGRELSAALAERGLELERTRALLQAARIKLADTEAQLRTRRRGRRTSAVRRTTRGPSRRDP